MASPIPKLQPGQKVRDWRRLYIAATALVTEKQQINLLPAYGARDAGEILIAESCTAKTTIVAALNELESLIDGTLTPLNSFKDFWACKPVKNGYNELIAFYFVLTNEGKAAKIPNDMVMMRYLNFVPGSEKIFKDHKELFVAAMTTANMAQVFTDVKKKLTTTQSRDNNGLERQIKQETNEYVFAAEEEEDEKPPAWARSMMEELNYVKKQVFDDTDDNQVLYNSPSQNFKGQGGNRPNQKYRCWTCNRIGHRAEACRERLCSNCGMRGHHEKDCYSKKGKEREGKEHSYSANQSHRGTGL